MVVFVGDFEWERCGASRRVAGSDALLEGYSVAHCDVGDRRSWDSVDEAEAAADALAGAGDGGELERGDVRDCVGPQMLGGWMIGKSC